MPIRRPAAAVPPSRARKVPAAVAVAVLGLLVAGCSAGGDAASPSASPDRTVTVTTDAADLTFAQATAALTADLVPAGEVERCEEYLPGTPEAEEHLAKVAAELEEARARAATADEAAALPTPALPVCGHPGLGDVRAASLLGHAFGPGDEISIPVSGGASRLVDVYEMPDADAAARVVAEQVADADGWAVDQEIPREDRPDGSYAPARSVTGAAIRPLDLPGWTGGVLSRDEVTVHDDGSRTSAVSYAFVWAARGPLLVRVQVAADDPGAAAAAATDVAQRFASAAGEVPVRVRDPLPATP